MHQTKTAASPALVTFILNGKTVAAPADHTILETADEHGIDIPRLCYMEGMRSDGNCRTCMVEIKGERVLAPSCCRYPKDGMEVTTNSARAVTSQKMSLELLLADIPETSYTLELGARPLGEEAERGQASVRLAPAAGRGSLASGDGRPPRRLHPVQALRPRLPRGAGQRRHRLCVPRRPLEDRVRPRRSDGRLDVRGMRRVRAGLSDRRADARARCRQDRPREDRRFGVPILRRRLPAHLQHQGQQDSLRPGQGRSGELEPAVREGPLRVRLRAAPPSADEAADSQEGRAEAQGLHRRSREVARGVPRGDVGRGARLRRQWPARHPRHLRQEGAGRFRLGEGHQRRGVSLPEAGAHRASGATTWTTARGSATRRASPR